MTYRANAGAALLLAVLLVGCGDGDNGGGSGSEPDAGADRTVPELPPPMPRPEPFEPVSVGFVLKGSEAQSQVPVTFGQGFGLGEVPGEASVALRWNGELLPTQVDAKAFHPDGSLRHAVLSVRLPELAPGEESRGELVLVEPAEPADPAATPEALLEAGFEARIVLELDGRRYVASAADALRSGEATTWLRGPIVTEWLLRAPLRGEDGAEHPNLVGRFAVRAYAGLDAVRVEAIVENVWTFQPGIQNFTYDVRIEVGEREVYRRDGLRHLYHARWRHVAWWGREPDVQLRHDTDYLQMRRFVPHYDPSITLGEAVFEQATERPYEPMGNGWINPYMPEAGADRGIAPLPWWQAVHIVGDGDPRLWQLVLDNGDAAASYPMHLRDKETDLPVSLDDYPRLTGDPSHPRGDYIVRCEGDCERPLVPDKAHQPSLAYYPYLLTGDHYYLEELLFWANYDLVGCDPDGRGENKGLFICDWQVRAQAWRLRTVAEAAFLTPDDHPFKAYLLEKLSNNAEVYRRRYVDGEPVLNGEGRPVTYANPLYVLLPRDLTEGKPWMDDFFTFAAARAAMDLGFEQWWPIFQWKARYPLGRMASEDDVYCWIFGATYQVRFGEGNCFAGGEGACSWLDGFAAYYEANWGGERASDGTYVRDMACGGDQMASYLAEQDERSYEPGEMAGRGRSPVGYPANLRPALAYIAEAGLPGSERAWSRLSGRARPPDYSVDPQFALSPRPSAASP